MNPAKHGCRYTGAWERVGEPVDYLCTGRVGIAETKRQRVRFLAVGPRDGRLRVMETDLELGDGRTLHAYDTGADDEDGRLAVFWHHGSPNIGSPPAPLSLPPSGSASDGCPTTDPATAGRPRARTGTWHRRPATPPPSPTL